MDGNIKSPGLIMLPLGWQPHCPYIISHSLVTLKWFHSGPTRAVFKNLWLFSKLTGKLQILVLGPWPCISAIEQILVYVIAQGLSICGLPCWNLNFSPITIPSVQRKRQDRVYGPSPSGIQVGVLLPACTSPLWTHPISAPLLSSVCFKWNE